MVLFHCVDTTRKHIGCHSIHDTFSIVCSCSSTCINSEFIRANNSQHNVMRVTAIPITVNSNAINPKSINETSIMIHNSNSISQTTLIQLNPGGQLKGFIRSMMDLGNLIHKMLPMYQYCLDVSSIWLYCSRTTVGTLSENVANVIKLVQMWSRVDKKKNQLKPPKINAPSLFWPKVWWQSTTFLVKQELASYSSNENRHIPLQSTLWLPYKLMWH